MSCDKLEPFLHFFVQRALLLKSVVKIMLSCALDSHLLLIVVPLHNDGTLVSLNNESLHDFAPIHFDDLCPKIILHFLLSQKFKPRDKLDTFLHFFVLLKLVAEIESKHPPPVSSLVVSVHNVGVNYTKTCGTGVFTVKFEIYPKK